MDKEVKAIFEVGIFDKKAIKYKIELCISNRCFYILKPYFDFVYKNKIKEEKSRLLTEKILRMSKVGIENASKCKCYQDFIYELLVPVEYSITVKNYIKPKMCFLEFPEEEDKKLTEFKEASKEIYTKYFKRKRRKNATSKIKQK